MVLGPETGRIFFSGMHDVALIEIVVIRCYFKINFVLMTMILLNKVVRHIFCFCFLFVQLYINQYVDTVSVRI